MKELVARNPKQLDICLRLLYAESVEFVVNVRETNKRKIYYAIQVVADDQRMAELDEKYRILIS